MKRKIKTAKLYLACEKICVYVNKLKKLHSFGYTVSEALNSQHIDGF